MTRGRDRNAFNWLMEKRGTGMAIAFSAGLETPSQLAVLKLLQVVCRSLQQQPALGLKSLASARFSLDSALDE
jgi:hypothetical protein